jgi:hypothetical protein
MYKIRLKNTLKGQLIVYHDGYLITFGETIFNQTNFFPNGTFHGLNLE